MTPTFNRIMLDVAVGTNRKVRRLSVPERWTFVAGVLPLAAMSPIRGALLVATSIPVTAKDVAEQAGVSSAVASRTLQHLRKLGMLEHDPDLDAEWVHDFQDWQTEPRSDPTAADRQKRYRDRQKTSRSHATQTVTRDVTRHVSNGGEVEVEEKTPPTPQGATVEPGRLDEARKRIQTESIERVFSTWVQAASKTDRTVLDDKRRRLIRRALERYPLNDVLDAVRGWKRSPHHRGENSSSTVYNDLGLLLRDGEHIEKFRDLERGAGQRSEHLSSADLTARAAEREQRMAEQARLAGGGA